MPAEKKKKRSCPFSSFCTETFQNIHGHAIVAGERLQEKMKKSVTCCFGQGSVQLVENVGSKSGLGSIWMFQCQNERCPSHETNLPFPTPEKCRAFAINRASVLRFELSVAVTRQPQKSLVGLLHITCQTPIVIARRSLSGKHQHG